MNKSINCKSDVKIIANECLNVDLSVYSDISDVQKMKMAVNNHAMWCSVSNILFIFECLEWSCSVLCEPTNKLTVTWYSDLITILLAHRRVKGILFFRLGD